MEVVQRDEGQEPPYFVHQMGNYLVVETDTGLVLLWDKKTSIFLRLSPEFKVRLSQGSTSVIPLKGWDTHGGREINREIQKHTEIERKVRHRDRKIERDREIVRDGQRVREIKRHMQRDRERQRDRK